MTRGPGPSLCLSLSWEPTVTTALSACPEVDDRSFVSAVNTPEQGRSPLERAVTAAPQSIAAMGVPLLVSRVMNLLVKSLRCRNVPLLMSSSVPASRV